MGREIPASTFERGDDERRTWDEMGWWDQPFSADDDDYPEDEDGVADDENDDPTTLEDWIFGWGEPLSSARERWLLADLDAEVRELEERIHYRDMAASAGQPIDNLASDADRERLATLAEFRRQHPDPAAGGDEPSEPPPPPQNPPVPAAPARPNPVRLVEAAIREKLSPAELLHWQELQKGTTQVAIAETLGIKQAAVSKRERKLRDRVDAISMETIGRPYAERLVDRGQWARQGRRRNKSASRQR